MNAKFASLRNEYPVFEYRASAWKITDNELDMQWHFAAGPDINFYPGSKLIFNRCVKADRFSAADLDVLVSQIGMIELVSYWKAVCSPLIINHVFNADETQQLWWKKLYFNGLGEFFYTNRIETDESTFTGISGQTALPVSFTTFPVDENTVIVPVGGGKDSIVTLELMRNAGMKVIPLIINPRGATLDTIREAGYKREDIIEIRREIDPALLELNAKGYLNGHTPFSAMLAFYTLLGAAACGTKYIALSNENSANESTVPGTSINHQYSKSLEFENDFRDYVYHYLHREVSYFSFLRPLSELQIVALFSGLKNYHAVFKSCNVGSKTDIWCGHCPKCLFAAVMLGAFLPAASVKTIFGKDILNDLELRPALEELSGLRPVKPFECVGTVSEVQAALSHIAAVENPVPALVSIYTATHQSGDINFNRILQAWDDHHFLPERFEKLLKYALETCPAAR